MQIRVSFYSYFRDLTDCAETTETLPAGSTLAALVERLTLRFPRLEGMQRAMLVAVGVDYQPREYVLKAGDEVSLFPPVQGG
ncbi:MAG: MoaD/ThiS family protein [Verrucomicrobia bacterium]|nr:MoaD/ThiS family protein [Verrucomicrobiota bacterium]